MSDAELLAGAAEVDCQAIVEAYSARCPERPVRVHTPWPQRLRCLVLAQKTHDEHDEAVVAIFNADWGRWHKLVEEARTLVAEAVPDWRLTVLCCPTQASYNIDDEGFYWGALVPGNRRYDPVLRQEILDALQEVFARAWQTRRPAKIAVGRGTCESLAANCYWGSGHTDPAVHVLRVVAKHERDATDAPPLAVLVHFACRGDDRVYGAPSAGFAGATAAVVRQAYGPAPVFHFPGCSGDHFPAFDEPLRDELECDGHLYQAALAPHLTREYARFGRALGGEVCKVLAEIEVAGRQLLTLNERWRYTSWTRPAPGLLPDRPVLLSEVMPVTLPQRPLPPPEDCDTRVRDLEAAMRPLVKRLPRPPRTHALALRPDDEQSTAARLMALGSAQAYWGIAAGAAKSARRRSGATQSSGEVSLVALGCDLAIVGIPGTTCLPTVRAIQAGSPFSTTWVWDMLAPSSLAHIIPEAEHALGGVHAATRRYRQESIDGMVAQVTDRLHAVHARNAQAAQSAG